MSIETSETQKIFRASPNINRATQLEFLRKALTEVMAGGILRDIKVETKGGIFWRFWLTKEELKTFRKNERLGKRD